MQRPRRSRLYLLDNLPEILFPRPRPYNLLQPFEPFRAVQDLAVLLLRSLVEIHMLALELRDAKLGQTPVVVQIFGLR